jgi:hypothetical protein
MRRGHKPSADVDDEAPATAELTSYDQRHLVTYLRLLDAAAQDVEWSEVARDVLQRDPAREPDRARRCWETHLARARWMREQGYRQLLK